VLGGEWDSGVSLLSLLAMSARDHILGLLITFGFVLTPDVLLGSSGEPVGGRRLCI
jgi:hypothetical protein